MANLTIFAQAAAFAKMWITASLFGVGSVLDGYFLALTAPTLIGGIVSGGLQTAIFPVRARLAERQGQEVAARFERSILAGVLLLGTILAFVVLLIMPVVIARVGESRSHMIQSSAIFVLPWAAMLVPLNAVGDTLGYFLAFRGRFPIAAAAPIANALLGAGLLLAWPEGGLLNLALGTVLGLILQVFICAWGLQKAGFIFAAPLAGVAERINEWREMAYLCGWSLPGVAFSNLTVSLPPLMLAAYGEGAISAFGYAWRLHNVAVQVAVMAFSPVVLARFSSLVAQNAHREIRRLVRKGAQMAIGLGAMATVFVWLFGAPFLELVFQGKFDANAASHVAKQWLWLTVGLFPAVQGNVLAKLWQARGHARMLSFLAGVGLMAFVGTEWLLSKPFGEQAVSAGLSISSMVVFLLLWGLYSSQIRTRIDFIR